MRTSFSRIFVDAPIGKVLIQTSEIGEPLVLPSSSKLTQLHFLKLPNNIGSYHVIVMVNAILIKLIPGCANSNSICSNCINGNTNPTRSWCTGRTHYIHYNSSKRKRSSCSCSSIPWGKSYSSRFRRYISWKRTHSKWKMVKSLICMADYIYVHYLVMMTFNFDGARLAWHEMNFTVIEICCICFWFELTIMRFLNVIFPSLC
jgi:hypothetical protein